MELPAQLSPPSLWRKPLTLSSIPEDCFAEMVNRLRREPLALLALESTCFVLRERMQRLTYIARDSILYSWDGKARVKPPARLIEIDPCFAFEQLLENHSESSQMRDYVLRHKLFAGYPGTLSAWYMFLENACTLEDASVASFLIGGAPILSSLHSFLVGFSYFSKAVLVWFFERGLPLTEAMTSELFRKCLLAGDFVMAEQVFLRNPSKQLIVAIIDCCMQHRGCKIDVSRIESFAIEITQLLPDALWFDEKPVIAKQALRARMRLLADHLGGARNTNTGPSASTRARQKR